MNISNKEKQLIFILLSIITCIILNIVVIRPMENKEMDLKIKKQEVLNKSSKKSNLSKNEVNKKYRNKEDIILNIENVLGDLVNIEYINKKSYDLEEGSDQSYNIEVKVVSNLNNIFQIEQKLKEIKLKNYLESLEISKIENNDEANTVECLMTFKVV